MTHKIKSSKELAIRQKIAVLTARRSTTVKKGEKRVENFFWNVKTKENKRGE